MPRKKAEESDEKSRGSCSLEAVKQYLMSDLIPEGYDTKSERRVLQRRAKSFVLIGDELYFTGGRSKHYRKSTENETGEAENPENDAECTQMLRKVVLSEKEQEEIIMRAHIGEDGCHYGMEKTTEQISNHYYWKGITYGIRNSILACPKCRSRVKNQGPEMDSDTTNTSSHASVTASSSNAAKETEAADAWDERTEDENADEGDENDDVESEKQSVNQEMTKVADDSNVTSEPHKLKKKSKKKGKPLGKKFSADRRKWGACSSLEIVRDFLLSDTVPEGYNKSDRRVLLRRAKSFILIKDDLYFTGGRTKQKESNKNASGTDDSETESEQTSVLRKVVFSEEEKQEILRKAHISDDGTHQGTERTKERVSNEYYWMGITYGVRDTINNCPKCSSRSKTPARNLAGYTAFRPSFTPKRVSVTSNKTSSAWKSKVAGKKGKEVDGGASGSGGDEGKRSSDAGLLESHSVKEELLTEDCNNKRESPQTDNEKSNKKQKNSTSTYEREQRKRGACCSLDVVRQYLLTNTVPQGYNRNDRRALLRRAKSFVMIKEDMYFTEGRSKQFGRTLNDSEGGGAEDPEDEPDHTQVLRKVVFSREEQQEVLNKAHIGEDGSHHGVEKTTERVSSYYYWLGITYGVRTTIANCASCSSRSKNLFRSVPFPSSLSDTTPITDNNQASATNTNTSASKNDEPASSWDMEIDDEHEENNDGDEDDGSDVNRDENRQNEADGTEAQSVKQESVMSWPLDVLTLSREVCSYFWQKVEIQMFGPYQAGKKLIYVAVALDTYSQFPEAVTMEVLSTATLTNFLLNLFCRYGAMEKVLLLQNEVTRNKDLCINVQDLLHAGISPVLQCPLINPLDERWNHIEKSLVRFISLYPDFWFHCLEAFLVPLRIALPPEAIYSPYYLVHGREAPVPDKLSQVCNVSNSGHIEVQLTEDQEKQTVDMVTVAYGVYSDNPSFPEFLPQPSCMDEPARTDTFVVVEKPKQEKQEATSRERKDAHEVWRCRRLRVGENEAREERVIDDEQSDMETEEVIGVPSEGETDPDDDSDRDATYFPNNKAIDKKSPWFGKRKRGRPRKIVSSDSGTSPDLFRINLERKKMMMGVQSSLIKNMKQLPLDAFYYIVRQYLEHDAFPPGISGDTKQCISRLTSMFFLKDGRLYSNVGKSAGRLIITAEKTRFSLLRKAHARAEVHHGRSSALKYLSDLNVFWNGMSLDLDAFIHCCPECIHHNPLGSQPVVTIPSKSPSLTQGGRKEDEPHMSEDEEEESSYEDLIQYLTDTTFPPTTTLRQQQAIQERSRSFRILQGSLYYQTHSMTQPRQVLFSHSLKRSAIQEAHIEEGQHLSQQDTQARLRGRYFWSGLTCDVVQHVMACCMKDAMATPPVLHRNPVIQERVDRIRSYYTEGKIPKLDTSALIAAEVRGSNCDTSLAKAYPSSSVAGFIPDHAVIKTLKNVIDGIDKQLSGKNKTTEKKDGGDGNQRKEGSTLSSRLQKANKCQYCGKYIGGMVAYKIHLYKHTGVKPFICSTCGKAFTTNRSLLIHTRKHTGIKPYLCNQCGRGFFRSASLLYHLRAHAFGRGTPVSCDICHRSFSTHNRLTRHKEFKHPAQAKVYICNQCGKHFTAARSLKRHEQIHTGHRKYQCHYCSKSFLRKEYLNSHLTNHTEYEQEKLKLKQREKPSKKSQPRSDESSMYWTPNSQTTHHLEAASTSSAEAYPSHTLASHTIASHTIASHTVASQLPLPTSNITTSHMSHLPPNSVMAHSQIHPLHHPISHAARLINVAGSHGPLPLTVSSARPPGDVVHGGSGAEILLQPEQFSVECLSGEGANLSEADLSAIHMLAQANITGPNLHSM